MSKRQIYKTNIYIPSESYLNTEEQSFKNMYEKTELEVCVIPSHNFKYATEVITGIKIPIASKNYVMNLDGEFHQKIQIGDKKERLNNYFILGSITKVDVGLFMVVEKKLDARVASKKDILQYRKKHPDRKAYEKSLYFLFHCFNERIDIVQDEKKVAQKRK